jgi:hypothetical protein
MFRNARMTRRGLIGLFTFTVTCTLLGGTPMANASDRAVLGELFSIDN